MEETPEKKWVTLSFLKESELLESNKLLQKFIEKWGVDLDDEKIIEKLARLPQNMVIVGLHNAFNMRQEKEAIGQLKRISAASKNPQEKEMFELVTSFTEKYGSDASFQLVRILEGEVENVY